MTISIRSDSDSDSFHYGNFDRPIIGCAYRFDSLQKYWESVSELRTCLTTVTISIRSVHQIGSLQKYFWSVCCRNIESFFWGITSAFLKHTFHVRFWAYISFMYPHVAPMHIHRQPVYIRTHNMQTQLLCGIRTDNTDTCLHTTWKCVNQNKSGWIEYRCASELNIDLHLNWISMCNQISPFLHFLHSFYVFMHDQTTTFIHTCMHAYIHTYSFMFPCMTRPPLPSIRTCIHTCIHTYI